MARKVRVAYAGAIYHVMARGNERAAFFGEPKDCELFLKRGGMGSVDDT